MSYNLLEASSLEEAKELIPANGDFVVIRGDFPKTTEEWKDSEGSSLPEEFHSLQQQSVVLVKITDHKVKFFKYPEKKSLCCTEAYHSALARL